MSIRVFSTLFATIYLAIVILSVHPASVGHWIATAIGVAAVWIIAYNFAVMSIRYQDALDASMGALRRKSND